MQDYNFLKIPYKKGGRTRFGADCFGIVSLFLHDNGIDFPSTKETDGKDWKRGFSDLASRLIKVDDPQRLDIVIISKTPKFHMGVFLDDRRILHMIDKGVLISDRRQLKTEEVLRWS